MKTVKVIITVQIEDDENPLEVVQDCDYIFTRKLLPLELYKNEDIGVLETEIVSVFDADDSLLF